MSKSLLDQLPTIVAEGKREAERIMERLESSYRLGLQTRELVIPSRDSNWQDMFRKAEKGSYDLNPATMNRLIYGDNLLGMAALLAGDDETPSMRGKVDLIYIDPPFDSKADYRTRVELPESNIEQLPTVIEQFSYSDTWADGTASYLNMMVPRLVLMRDFLSETGSVFVHLDWHVIHYIKIIMDEIYGRDNFRNEILAKRKTKNLQNQFEKVQRLNIASDSLLWFSKNADARFPLAKKQFEGEANHSQWNNFFNNADRPTLRYPLLGIELTHGQWLSLIHI